MTNLALPSLPFTQESRAEAERVPEHLLTERGRAVGLPLLNRSRALRLPTPPHPDVEPEFLPAGVLIFISREVGSCSFHLSRRARGGRKTTTPHFPWLSLSHLQLGRLRNPTFPFPVSKATGRTGGKHTCQPFLGTGRAEPFLFLGSQSRARSGGRAGGPLRRGPDLNLWFSPGRRDTRRKPVS